MEISRLSDRIKNKTLSKLGPEDPNWVQFIHDHKDYLREKCARKEYVPLDLVQYKNCPAEFVVANHGDLNVTWIFMLLNDLQVDSDFNESLNRLWIVNMDEIRTLRKYYESSVQYQAAART